MKKLVVIVLVFFSAPAFAGVKSIKSNRKVSGIQSYWVQCTSSKDFITYRKNGTWYRGDIGHMGDKFNSWNRDKVAEYVCR